jgi:alpha-amylase
MAMILQFTSIGIPLIYYGEEVGRPGGDWPDNRSDMPWGNRKIMPGAGQPRDEKLRADYKKMIAIRREHAALSLGYHTAISTEGDLLVFQMQDAASGDTVIVAVNRGASPAQAGFKIPEAWEGKTIQDAWNQNESVAVKEGQVDSAIPAKGARIFVAQGAK